MGATFLELYSQLPKPERTPRNAVLLALLVLGAETVSTAIESGAIAEELKLRLGAKAPGNVPDVLAKAGARVERVATSKKALRWYITSTGLADLGIVRRDEPAAPPKFDVAVVCALHSPELQAVFDCFGGEKQWASEPDLGQTHVYKSTRISSINGENISIIAGAPTRMGLTATAVMATQMLLLFRPRLIAMVGIAAGTKAPDRGYGDVLIANPSVDYASGKVTVRDGVEVFQPDPFPLPVDSRLHALLQEERRTRDGLDVIASKWGKARPVTTINLHIGPLGAADQVVDSARRIDDVQRNWRKLVGVDMETYALYRAAYEAPKPKPLYLALKSVCDFAAEKTDTWQDYAAFTAASYFHHFLKKHWSSMTA